MKSRDYHKIKGPDVWAKMMYVLLLASKGLLKEEKISTPLYPRKPTGLPEQRHRLQGNWYCPRKITGFNFSSGENGLQGIPEC